jgi:hypothetical protein
VSNNTDPKREHDYEIVLKPPEVAFFSPENKHTRTLAHGFGKKVCVLKGQKISGRQRHEG